MARRRLRCTAIGTGVVMLLAAGAGPAGARRTHDDSHASGSSGLVNPIVGDVTVAGPDGNPVIDPATGKPFLVDMNAMNTPPTNIPGNTFQVATDLTGDPITVVNHLPTGTGAGLRIAPLNLGEEFYIVPTHAAAEALTSAP